MLLPPGTTSASNLEVMTGRQQGRGSHPERLSFDFIPPLPPGLSWILTPWKTSERGQRSRHSHLYPHARCLPPRLLAHQPRVAFVPSNPQTFPSTTTTSIINIITMADEKTAPKKPVPVQLRDPSPYRGQGSYTESLRPSRDVQHIIAGSTAKGRAHQSVTSCLCMADRTSQCYQAGIGSYPSALSPAVSAPGTEPEEEDVRKSHPLLPLKSEKSLPWSSPTPPAPRSR